MRRFSQRNPLVTLSDINITPLLDLAFVLLIIFVITTPLLEQGINMKLPTGGAQDSAKIDPSDVRTIEVTPTGLYLMKGRQYSLPQLISALLTERRNRPRLLPYIRGDQTTPWVHMAAVIDALKKAGMDEMSFRTEPPSTRPRTP